MTAISQAPGAHGLVVIFAIDDQRIGLDIAAVERVIRAVEVTPLPEAPAGVTGIVNLQGRVIPVLDLRPRFQLPAREMQVTDHMLIVRVTGRTVALVVDEVTGVTEWNPVMVVEGGKILPGFDAVEGVVKLEDGLVIIHDPDKFLSLEEASHLEAAIAMR